MTEDKVSEFGLSDKKLSPTALFSVISPWPLEDARMDLNLLRKERERGEKVKSINMVKTMSEIM